MTIGELKQYIKSNDISDDFEIAVVGEHSGSYGTVIKFESRIEPFSDGDYKELMLFIDG